jgi:hypothetical protein
MKGIRVGITAAVLAAVAMGPAACKRQKARPQATVEEAAPLASTVHMGDPKEAAQLVAGFHGVEANAWRWTARAFQLKLRPPAGAAQKGATLVVKLTVPPVVAEKEKRVTLSASVNGTALAPQTFEKSGSYTYQRDVPAQALAGDAVLVDFQLDKAMPPSGGDQRELGIIVLSAGLEPK